MPLSSKSVEPDLYPVIELAFEAAWRKLRLTPGRVHTPLIAKYPLGPIWQEVFDILDEL